MLRSAFLVFLAGWTGWFLLDKNGLALPPAADSVLQNFQFAFDTARSGYPAAAFLFVWNAHFVLLSLLGGALVSMLLAVVGDMLGRRRMRRLLFPSRRQAGNRGAAEQSPLAPGQSPVSTDRDQ